MIDTNEKTTQALDLDEQPAKRKRGRPATGAAMTAAEKQRAYRERQKAAKGNVTPKLLPGAVLLTEAENNAIVCMLQDKAREIATRSLCGGPVTPDQLKVMEWLSALALKVAASDPDHYIKAPR